MREVLNAVLVLGLATITITVIACVVGLAESRWQ
jgi:hypothetical protein